MLPVAGDAEPLELLPLHGEPVLGIGPALPAERDHGGGIGKVRLRLALGAVVLLLDLPLDRQAVAVPAGHVGGIEAEHLLGARHHVLEDLVERVADMDVAVGIGRPVMEHEFRPARARLAQATVEAGFLPLRQDLGLLLGQPGAHGKIGLGQEQKSRCSRGRHRAWRLDLAGGLTWHGWRNRVRRSRSSADPEVKRKPGR